MTSSIAVVCARGKIFSTWMQCLGITDNDCVGVCTGDKTCKVDDGIRVIFLGNFVELLERRGNEINVLRQCLNIYRRDIYVRRRSRDQHWTIECLLTPEKGYDIEIFYQEYPQTSPMMSNVIFVSDLFNRVSFTIKSIDRYAKKLKSYKCMYVKTIKILL